MKKIIVSRIIPIAICFILIPLGLGATFSHKGHQMEPPKLTREDAPFKGTDLEPFDMEGQQTAQIVLKAFQTGYPTKITDYGYDEEAQDWFIRAGEQKFFWAQGRLLPETLRHQAEQWRHYIDYLYPKELPNPEDFSPELIEEIKRTSQPDFRANQKSYNLEFYHALYDGKTRGQLEQHIVSTRFFGKKVNLHQDIVLPLALVEKAIQEAAQRNSEVQDFINNIGSVEGYNWREIRDRQDRSFHSWGLAVDILPKGWQKKNIYWSWISEWNPNWMMIPLHRRWMPPQIVIEIFEKHGFTWGGKWLQWDNIHFEYRPELLLLQEYQ